MAADTDRATIFISHVQADRAWAEWIAGNLRAVGVRTMTGAGAVPVGSSIIDAIRTEIAISDTVLVLLSERASQSPWVRAETALANATGKRLVGVVVEEGAPIPADLRETEVLELAGASLDTARARLISVFEPSRVDHIPELRTAVARQAPPPTLHFVNRERELELLEATFLSSTAVEPATVVVAGPAGIGKTALAAQFVHRHRASFPTTHWLRASTRSEQPRLDKIDPGDLVVIDDADDYQVVAEVLQEAEPAHVLILSRAAYWGRPFQVINLAALDQASARALIQQLAPGASDEEAARLTALAAGLPLAISLIASKAQTQARPLSNLLPELEAIQTTFVTSSQTPRGYYFLDTDDPHTISSFERALEDVFEANDAPVDLQDQSRGSWRGWWRRRYPAERMDALADKAERAAEVAALTKPEGEANRSHAEAVARLIESTADIPNLVVIAGSVLLIKVTDATGPRVVSKTLTATELRRFEEQDELLSDPARALAFLQDRQPPSSQLDAGRDG
jgi:TIR domain-containing protein